MKDALKNLERNGYHLENRFFTEDQANELKNALLEIPEESTIKNEERSFHGSNTTLIPNIITYSESFINLAMNDKFISLATDYFEPGQFPGEEDPFQLASMHARKVSKNAAQQQLHIDSRLCGANPPLVLQVFIYLDDCLDDGSGATQVVPGSHDFKRYSNKSDYAKVKELKAPKGSVIFLNANLFHGSSAKKTDGDRWIITLAYSRWWIRQSAAIPYFVGWPRELTDKEKRLFGFFNYGDSNNNNRHGARGKLPTLVPKGHESG